MAIGPGSERLATRLPSQAGDGQGLGRQEIVMAALTTRALQLSLDPARGGKITSLVDRRSDREWLLTPARPCGPPAGYGASFVGHELSGWDEMLPTIVACQMPSEDGPVELPDHGEVWSVPWETTTETPTAITVQVRARRWPVSIERTVEVVAADVVRFTYRLANRSRLSVPVLWAAHPQFLWRPGSRIELPSQVESVLDVTTGPEPRETPWAEPLGRLLDHLDEGRGHKVWTLPGQRPAWARLRDADGGSLTIAFDPDVVPYVGVWWDACAYATRPTVAIEPSTGFYDDLSTAVAARRVPWLAPDGALEWTVDLRLTPPGKMLEGGGGHR